MRIRYTGMDGRVRVAQTSRVKFMDDGFKPTDNSAERNDNVSGPVIVAHVLRTKGGGKRLIMEAPPYFNMEAAELALLKEGWLDLIDLKITSEGLY